MNAAWTDVAQDAVKIGLGAVIGLLGNGFLAKKTRDHEITEARRLAKKNDFSEVERLLNDFRIEFGSFYDEVRTYKARLAAAADFQKGPIRDNLANQRRIAANALNKLVGVDSKLSLWGEEKALKSFRRFSEGTDECLDELWEMHDLATTEQIDEMVQKTFTIRDAFYKEAGLLYRAIE